MPSKPCCSKAARKGCRSSPVRSARSAWRGDLFSEATYVCVFDILDKRDFKIVEGVVPAEMGAASLWHHWRWFDRARRVVLNMKPVPKPEVGRGAARGSRPLSRQRLASLDVDQPRDRAARRSSSTREDQHGTHSHFMEPAQLDHDHDHGGRELRDPRRHRAIAEAATAARPGRQGASDGSRDQLRTDRQSDQLG